MSERSTLQRKPGTLVDRITPTGWELVEGSKVWCLGSDEPGWTGRFNPGDGAVLKQSGTYGTAKLLRLRARLRGPRAELPAFWRWEAYAKLNGAEVWTLIFPVGRTVDMADLAFPLTGNTEPLEVRFGIRAVGPGGAAAEELELPAFYLDELVFDSVATALRLSNRYPEPGGVNVPRVGSVRFDLVDPLGVGVSLPLTTIRVDGVVAYDGANGGTQAGFTVVPSTVATGQQRFVIDRAQAYDSERLVHVEVITSTADGSRVLGEAYSFTITDQTPPSIRTVQSRELQVVRVTYSEPVEDAALPERYIFSRLSSPAVEVQASTVQAVSATEYDVILDIPITMGGRYLLVITNVRDVKGNVILEPYNRAEFNGFQPVVPAGRKFNLWEMVPRLNREEDALQGDPLWKLLSIFQEVVNLLLNDVDRWLDVIDPDTAPEPFVDQMLIRMGNPFRFPLTLEDKRRLVRVLVPMYRQKGTFVGMVNAIRFFIGVEVQAKALIENAWRLGTRGRLGVSTNVGPGDSRPRYSFEIISPVELTEEQRSRIRAVVKYLKPAWTHFVRLVEPTEPEVINHLQLGRSRLGREWRLH